MPVLSVGCSAVYRLQRGGCAKDTSEMNSRPQVPSGLPGKLSGGRYWARSLALMEQLDLFILSYFPISILFPRIMTSWLAEVQATGLVGAIRAEDVLERPRTSSSPCLWLCFSPLPSAVSFSFPRSCDSWLGRTRVGQGE